MTLLENVRSVSFVDKRTLKLAVGCVILTLNTASKPAYNTTGRLCKISPFLVLNSTHGLIESFLDNSHPENKDLNNIIVGIVYDSLEEVKHSVLMKEWKIKQKLEEKHEIEENIRKNKNI